MANILGHRLAMARHARQLSQMAVAKQVGISQKHLSQIEKGRVQVRSVAGGTLLALAQCFDVTTDYLLGRDLRAPVDATAPADPDADQVGGGLRQSHKPLSMCSLHNSC